MSNNQIVNALNTVLANATVLYQKMHTFHWEVKGEQFFALHGKFEEQYELWAKVIDDVAERILTIGGHPLTSLQLALQTATVKESDGRLSAKDMVKATIDDLQEQRRQITTVVEAAEKTGDRGTVNLLDPVSDEIEKTIWMLRAWLA